MVKKEKAIIIVLIVVVILFAGFVLPGLIDNRGEKVSISPPPSPGGKSPSSFKILLDKSFSGIKSVNCTFSVESNFTSITVETWNNGTNGWTCSVTNPNGTIETGGTVQAGTSASSAFVFYKSNKIVYGEWNVNIDSSSNVKGSVIIKGNY